MTIEGFTGNGAWYKGNLHCHTTLSDGRLAPEQAVALYREHGYSFLCMSDHDLYADHRAAFDSGGFLTLPGVESTAVLFREADAPERLKIHHIHGILGTREMQENAPDGIFSHLERVPPLVFYGEWDGARAAQQAADRLARHGCLACYNHPVWSRVSGEEFMRLEGVHMLEIYNHGSAQESATGYDVTFWDQMLRMGRRVNCVAADDNHNEGDYEDSFGGWVCVRAPALTHDGLVRALIAGNYYASSGPEIYAWGVRDGTAWVDCSPVNRVHFICGNFVNDGAAVLGRPFEDSLAHAERRLRGHESYLRVECVDKFGRTAWTNPVFF